MRKLWVGLCVAALVSPVVSLVAGPAAESASGDRPALAGEAEAAARPRVVWDEWKPGRRGIHLRSARVDGRGQVRVYDRPRGFTLHLVLDPSGRRVAFSPCCRASFPQLIVAPVRGGRPTHPLARHPHVEAVGGIGWSADGRRLVFEANGARGDSFFRGIWTVRADGRDLRLLYRYGPYDPEKPWPYNEELVWLRRGVLFSDGTDLLLLESGRTSLVARRVRDVAITGDRQHLVLTGWRGDRYFTWLSDLHARERTVLEKHVLYEEGVTYRELVVNHDGSAVLAERETATSTSAGMSWKYDMVVWRVADGPGSAVPLDFISDGSYAATWY